MKFPGFSKPEKNSIYFLNISQFMGVLNDNIFKLVIAFLLIDIAGSQFASNILSKAGALFVIPFLLFSSAAGVLADRFSKQRLMVCMKVLEMFIMAFAMIAFSFKIVWGSYLLLFILAAHSALFGPSKYAIISELVPPEKVSRANGLITSFIYIGVIAGTFLASFLTEIASRNFVLVAGFCFLIALIGLISTLGIKYTSPHPEATNKKINPFFLQEIGENLKFCRGIKHLILAIFGSAYFLFIGSYTQLNIIPFAIESLHLRELDGGYLFLPTALGIAVGAYLAGKAFKIRIELVLSCLAGFCISGLLGLLCLLSSSLIAVIVILFLLGVFAGFFIVPFETFVQVFSPDEKRGQIIATNNFLSFCGVLMASFALYVYSEILSISPSHGFALTGLITFFFSLSIMFILFKEGLNHVSRFIIKPFVRIKTINKEIIDENKEAVLILKGANWKKALLLLIVAPRAYFFLIRKKAEVATTSKKRWYRKFFFPRHDVKPGTPVDTAFEEVKEGVPEHFHACFFVKEETLLSPPNLKGSTNSTDKTLPKFIEVNIDLSKEGSTITFSDY